jgi:hypothetical protein
VSAGYFDRHGKVVNKNGKRGDKSTLWYSYETCGQVDTFSQSAVDGKDTKPGGDLDKHHCRIECEPGQGAITEYATHHGRSETTNITFWPDAPPRSNMTGTDCFKEPPFDWTLLVIILSSVIFLMCCGGGIKITIDKKSEASKLKGSGDLTGEGWFNIQAHCDSMVCTGGASSTGYDIRSGSPQEENIVRIMRLDPGVPDAFIKEVYLIYRYVIGYSGDGTTMDHVDNPCFKLTAAEIGSDQKSILYHSPQFATKPYNWDAGEGGDPHNYSDAKIIHETGCNAPCGASGVVLQLEFMNNNRNMNLQGEHGTDSRCDLQLRVRLQSGGTWYKGDVKTTTPDGDDVEWPV